MFLGKLLELSLQENECMNKDRGSIERQETGHGTRGEEETKGISWVLSSPNYGSKRKEEQVEMIYPELAM